MSLLLEALKKAEKAKEDAQRRAREERQSGEPEELRSEGEAPADGFAAEPAAPAPVVPVLTRDKLPEISQKLEILSDDLDKSADRPAAEPTLAPVEPPRGPAAGARAAPPPRDESRVEASRATARKVFEAKFREPNPRMPFYLTLGVLGAFGIGTFIYFWIQLRPAPPLVNANPPRQAEPPVMTAEAKPATIGEPASTASAIPGLPGAASTPPAPPPAMAAPAAAAAAPRAPQAPVAERVPVPEVRPAPRPAQRPAPSPLVATSPETSVARAAPRVHPRVESGYAAYIAGNLDAARADYQQALNEDPTNRDATLGLAAIDVRAGRFEAAESAYLRLLQADPRDAEAQAALIALRSGRVDPLAAESRLKSMLAADPKAHALNFALGNQLAQQGRWAEAQAQYFKAFAAEPGNADFAYNLAVSLDHLRQPKQALEYYRQALALAKTRGGSFDAAAAEGRVAQLSQ